MNRMSRDEALKAIDERRHQSRWLIREYLRFNGFTNGEATLLLALYYAGCTPLV